MEDKCEALGIRGRQGADRWTDNILSLIPREFFTFTELVSDSRISSVCRSDIQIVSPAD